MYYEIVLRDVKDLFDLSIDEDYYKPKITNSAFDNNYIQYGSRGNKDKILTSEWKIQLTMAINFISSKKDSDEIRIMLAKSDNVG